MIPVNMHSQDFINRFFKSDKKLSGSIDCSINNVCFDSREVAEGDMFVVLPSVAGNEMQYIQTALNQGAALLVSQFSHADLQQAQINTANLQVDDVMVWSGDFLSATFQVSLLDVVGITGTNGKSSISFYVAQALKELHKNCAVMGTLGYGSWDELTATGMTTLPLEKLHTTLAQLEKNYDVVAMEVSSHGLEQQRLSGVNFKGAVFSNLSRDHLDYHGTMEAYGAEKAKLFQWPNLEFAVINIDDEFGKRLFKQTQDSVKQSIAYGQNRDHDSQPNLGFEIKSVLNHGLHMAFTYNGKMADVIVPLYGEFNGYNACATLGVLLALGHDFEQCVLALSVLQPVDGRMMQVSLPSQENKRSQLPLVLVDYAHTPDALEQVLKSVQHHSQGNVYLVVGCGGDRDQGKRPLMGKIAVQFADKVVFTSDNPRSESPSSILEHMVSELDGSQSKFDVLEDRQQAINEAITMASSDDLVIIAGKGHEDYQEIQGQRQYFSDKEVALAALQSKRQVEIAP